ncbi:nitrogenase iron-molybdenum cofactor biosynthesis protein NifE [Desulfatitalea sp. M08but]|uniref:Nitrogenase iron-molybdenum cofactor biosynthesis protein NifE n=2 Tax=Desulfatitalea alkaliphila TaxID=2929485 RepID=A0AA41UGW0_9BACT|nr:nitrogenase iron-molybdenum cofactor biosynthesis protein NifE [Desulfatitalea alkaliphila]
MTSIPLLREREKQIHDKAGGAPFEMACDRHSLAGSVSQRACVFCGSRVVLYPIADALHLVHGPIGCAAYTWDIRGALSSGPQLHRMSFSTDLGEREVIFGGEKRLYKALTELIAAYRPKAAFVYSTCIVGIIGDDVAAVCRRVEKEQAIPVLPVHSEGFKGTKKDGYKAACDALFGLVGTGDTTDIAPVSINILGEFNIGGEAWLIRRYYEQMGVQVVSVLTGDGRVDDVRRAHGATLNVVQCSGAMTFLAEQMQARFGIPYIRASYFGLEDTAKALYDVAAHFSDHPDVRARTETLVREAVAAVMPELRRIRAVLEGKCAAVYVGGAFKVFSLIKALRLIGMRVVLAGSQTGNADDYAHMRALCDPDTVILDDANPLELSRFVVEKGADLFIGGVKERPIAYKLGLGFCDHNHERKTPLAGFEGMRNFAREVHLSVTSPVWEIVKQSSFKC